MLGDFGKYLVVPAFFLEDGELTADLVPGLLEAGYKPPEVSQSQKYGHDSLAALLRQMLNKASVLLFIIIFVLIWIIQLLDS